MSLRLRACLAPICLLGVMLLTACPGESWRTIRPDPLKEVRVEVPIFGELRLPSGLTLVHYQTPQTPMVAIELVLRVGAASLSAQQAGLAQLYLSLLGQSSPEAAAQLDALGVEPVRTVATTGMTYLVRVPLAEVESTLAFLASQLRSPRVDPQILEQKKSQLVSELRHHPSNPFAYARWIGRRALYGAGHPLSQREIGTASVISQLSAGDVEAFARRFIGPQNVAVVVVGAISRPEAAQYTAQAFADWRADVERPVVLRSSQPPAERKVWFVPKPGLAQSVLLLGGMAPVSGHEDEAPFHMASDILAGFILNSVRNRAHVSYGVHLVQSSGPSYGHFMIDASVDRDATASALSAMTSDAFSLAADGFRGSAMPMLRLHSIFEEIRSFDTLAGTADAAAELVHLGRPITHYQKLLMAVPKIRQDSVLGSIERYLRTEKLQVVVLADPSYSDAVEQLHLGPMIIVNEQD